MAIKFGTNNIIASSISGLNQNQLKKGNTLDRLSGGIHLVKDDPAGAAVADNLRTETDAHSAARRSMNDGISVAQTADGATAQVGEALGRMRELAVSASSELLSGSARDALQQEFSELGSEIGRIAASTEFNGVPLTDGAQPSLDVQVGTNGSSQFQLELGDLTASSLGLDLSAINLSSAADAQTALGHLDGALDTVADYRSDYGSSMNRLESAYQSSETASMALSSAHSQISDVDYAAESAALAAQQIKEDLAIAAMAQAKKLSPNAVMLLGG